ncbi:MAG: hypothetical protein Q8S13_05860 [Dehalococcoidia bacterium]|nr:hypothetical protein [Dehalococcoidia bacterium]
MTAKWVQYTTGLFYFVSDGSGWRARFVLHRLFGPVPVRAHGDAIPQEVFE